MGQSRQCVLPERSLPHICQAQVGQSDVDVGVYPSLRTPARKIRLGLSNHFVLLDDCEEVQPALHGAKDSR